MSSNSRLFALLATAFGVVFLSPSLSAKPIVEITREAVTVSGIPARSAVALLSVAREPAYYMVSVVSRHELLVDDDGDGRVRYAPKNGIAPSSIWITVALSTGELNVSAPAGFSLLEMQQRGAGNGKAVEAVLNTLEISRSVVELLVVRPGTGAWSMRARDGGVADHDGKRSGKLKVDLSKLRSLGAAGSPPQSLKKGDVVAVLDSEAMRYWATTVDPGGN